MAQPRVVGVIPARLNSSRLPRKVLRSIAGLPMVLHVFQRAKTCERLDEVVVATDSEEVAAVCRRASVPVELTSPHHASGTDRLFEVAGRRRAEIYVNIQGDEPLINREHLESLLDPFDRDPQTQVSTLRIAINAAEAQNPNVVKVVCDRDGHAIYFSRHPIPFDRDGSDPITYYKHMGLYAYRRNALAYFHSLSPSPLERAERLEQLRFLENGVSIQVAETTLGTIGVDTEDDLQAVEAILHARAA